jgi:DNA-binding NarL/FixJ family response regulator
MEMRILIAEDHALMRAGLKALLSPEHGIVIVAEACDGKDAYRQALSQKPSLILMDISMPGTDGIQAIRTIKRRLPEIRVIVLTVHKAEEHVRTALDAGADGYVLKDDTHNELITAIRCVGEGKTFLSPGICDKVINGYLNHSSAQPTKNSWEILTHRERQVIKLIAEGHKNKEIAQYLAVSIKTVEKHRSNLMNKLDLHNGQALTAYAIEKGMVSH